jgi:hypothetical protein
MLSSNLLNCSRTSWAPYAQEPIDGLCLSLTQSYRWFMPTTLLIGAMITHGGQLYRVFAILLSTTPPPFSSPFSGFILLVHCNRLPFVNLIDCYCAFIYYIMATLVLPVVRCRVQLPVPSNPLFSPSLIRTTPYRSSLVQRLLRRLVLPTVLALLLITDNTVYAWPPIAGEACGPPNLFLTCK